MNRFKAQLADPIGEAAKPLQELTQACIDIYTCGFRVQGFRVLGFRVLGFRVKGLGHVSMFVPVLCTLDSLISLCVCVCVCVRACVSVYAMCPTS